MMLKTSSFSTTNIGPDIIPYYENVFKNMLDDIVLGKSIPPNPICAALCKEIIFNKILVAKYMKEQFELKHRLFYLSSINKEFFSYVNNSMNCNIYNDIFLIRENRLANKYIKHLTFNIASIQGEGDDIKL